MPAFAEMFMNLAGGLSNYVLYILAMLAIFGASIAFYFRTPSGSYQRDRLALSLPMIGTINRLRELAYCCRTMAVLFRSGLSSTEIMDITIESCNNKLMTQALMRVKEEMLKGEGIAQPMSRDGLFLPMMVEMVRVGEETGGLGETLVIVSQTYDAEADAKSRTFSRFLQTAVTMGISAMVFIVVLIMFSAMYSIYGQMSL
jgi:type IV pilus assembly protein PilC